MVDIQPPKLYLNGLPKSGIHLAQQMVACLFKQVKPENNWFGTNPWTIERYELDKVIDEFTAIRSQHYLKGHTGYMTEIDRLFETLHLAMLFVYRDLRDVVVSQTYHILNDDKDKYIHMGRWVYDQLGAESKEAVMWECIVGNETLPGVIDRWNEYEPWMDLPYVHTVRFEDMIQKPEKVASEFFDWVYGIAIAEDDLYLQGDVRREAINLMVAEMKKKFERSTFRKGTSGQWKREFTPEHVAAFTETDKDNVLYKLGYAKQVDW